MPLQHYGKYCSCTSVITSATVCRCNTVVTVAAGTTVATVAATATWVHFATDAGERQQAVNLDQKRGILDSTALRLLHSRTRSVARSSVYPSPQPLPHIPPFRRLFYCNSLRWSVAWSFSVSIFLVYFTFLFPVRCLVYCTCTCTFSLRRFVMQFISVFIHRVRSCFFPPFCLFYGTFLYCSFTMSFSPALPLSSYFPLWVVTWTCSV